MTPCREYEKLFITELFIVSANDCKTRWRSIKDYRHRQKKLEAKFGTGSGATKRKAGYWNRLNFLDSVEEERATFSNVDPDETELQVVNENFDLDSTLNEVDDPIQPTVTPIYKSSLHEKTNTEVNQPKKKKVRKDKDLMEMLKMRDEQRAENRKLIDKVLLKDEDDEIDLFFKAMAATVKKFSDQNKVETKMQVFNIISQMELRDKRYRNVESMSTYNYQDDYSNHATSSASFVSMATPGPSHTPSPTTMELVSSETFPNHHFSQF